MPGKVSGLKAALQGLIFILFSLDGCSTYMRIVQAGCDALHALECGSRQGLGFFNPHGLFADSAHTDTQESIAL